MIPIIEFLNGNGGGFCHHALWMFVHVSILVGVLWGLDLVLRKRVRASVRYSIWLLVLLKLVLPVDLRLPSGVGYWLNLETRTPAPIRAAVFPPSAMKIESENPLNPPAAIINTSIDNAAPSPPVIAERPSVAQAAPSLTLAGLLFGLWLAGVFCLAGVMTAQFVLVRKVIAGSNEVSADMGELLRRCQSALQMRRTIRIRESKDVGSPAVCGLLRPIILIPSGVIAKLSDEQLEKVLLHELMHIERYDLWVNLVQNCLQLFYFYNPLVRFANGRIRTAREQANDEQVLVHLKGKREDYSATLIEIAAAAVGRPMLAVRLVGVAEPKTHLHERITLMMQKPIPKTARLGLWGTLALVVLGLALLPMAGRIQAAAQLKAANVPAMTPEKFLAEVKTLINTMVKGNQTGDAQLSASAYTDDAVSLPTGANPAVEKYAIVELYNQAINKGERVLTVDAVYEDVRQSGRYVMSIDRSMLTVRVPGLEHLLLLNCADLNIWEVQPDGSLKLKADAWNFLPTPSGNELLSGQGITARNDVFRSTANSHKTPDASPETLEQIKQLDLKFHEECLNNTSAIGAYYADDCIYLADRVAPMRGKKQVQDNITASQRRMKMESLGHTILFAEGSEEMVYVVNTFQWKGTDLTSNTAFDVPGKGVHVWQKQPDGSWKILVDINSLNIEQ